MPIVSVPKSGNLDQKFVTLVKQLREPLHKLGFGMYRGTALDTLAYMETGDRSTAIVQQGVDIDDSGYRMVALGKEATFDDYKAKVISECGYQRMDFWGKKWNRLMPEAEKRRVLASMSGLAEKPMVMPLLECLELLRQGETKTCLYDGKAFFHAAHLVDPTGADVADNQAPNLLTIDLDTAGWNTLLQTIIDRPDPGSKPSEDKVYLPNRLLNGDTLEIWTSQTEIFTELSKIFDPKSVWANSVANASEYRLRYAQATLQMVPEMRADDYFYAIVKTAPMRGIFARMPDAPDIDELKAGTDLWVKQKEMLAHCFATFGCAYYFPFAIYKVKIGS